MLVNIASRLDEEAIRELLEWSVFPDPEHLRRAVELYKDGSGHTLLGYESEGDVIGLIGYHRIDGGAVEIDHIAVTPEERYKGYGRGMILELLELEKPTALVAETDEDAADFYRSSRFTVVSLGEKYPGTERFRCTYEAGETEEDEDD
ncbi:GNAT family N-acetyltransferase [Paenibacillus sp. MWE-103]|uniref:GNAT family N-acetyltransferase n=1 Tax=Paenibacillus artemisiicola TaxID=1172618 RepID=A0ABS3WF22_9BACL|nr:GNAT family N-acetyltransferase [Paenibacillus artemisiicola]MBO7746877.1 GNAT family N-acetyltransferase [Paenibacillus artemisiicola]